MNLKTGLSHFPSLTTSFKILHWDSQSDKTKKKKNWGRRNLLEVNEGEEVHEASSGKWEEAWANKKILFWAESLCKLSITAWAHKNTKGLKSKFPKPHCQLEFIHLRNRVCENRSNAPSSTPANPKSSITHSKVLFQPIDTRARAHTHRYIYIYIYKVTIVHIWIRVFF